MTIEASHIIFSFDHSPGKSGFPPALVSIMIKYVLLIIKKYNHQYRCVSNACAFVAESERRDNGHHEDNNNDEDEMHMFEGLNLIIPVTCESVFQGPTLPVTCGSVSGILHKSRFATGLFHILILTDGFLMTGIVNVTLDHKTYGSIF